MSYPVFYPIEGDVLPILFDTFAGSTGASVTMSGLAVTDIEIYKDGSTTQRSSDAGYTLLDTDGIDFDGLTGIHGFSIDLADNTDSGFFTVGPWYHVVVSAITIDSQTVSFIAAAFRIVSATRGLAGTALPNAAADAAGGLPISDAGGLDLDAKIGALTYGTANRVNAQVYGMENNTITASAAAADFSTEIRTAINGGDYALSTDANGRIRIVDGTGTGELNTASGSVDVVTIEGSDATDQINAACDAAIETYHLDHLLAATYDPASKPGAADALLNELVENDGGVARFTTNALEQGPSGSGASAASIADAVWDELQADHVSAGSFGEIASEIASALADTNELQTDWANGGRLDLIIDAILADTGTDGVVVNAAGLATDAVQELRNAITGGAYALSTDANGRIRIVDGTSAGELDTSSGLIAGIAGTITTLDALDTAQDTQHSTTQGRLPAALVGGRMDCTIDGTGMESGAVAAILTAQMTEAYAANGVAPTLAQALFAIHQKLMARQYSGLDSIVLKLDGVTEAFQGQLNDATNPTEDIRA